MIPFHTTKITITRPDTVEDSGDPYDETEPDYSVVDKDIRAVIVENAGGPTGPGDNEVTAVKMRCDPCDLQHRDRVKDQVTGVEYDVESAFYYAETPGLDHVKARLRNLNLGKGVN